MTIIPNETIATMLLVNSSSLNTSSPKSTEFHMTGGRITWGIAFVVVGALITITNLLTLLIYGCNSRLRRRSVYCLMNLAAADIIVGSVAMPIYSSYFLFDSSFYRKHGLTLVYITDIVYNFTSNMSMFSLVLVSVERMFATVCPWRYRNTSTRSFFVALGVAWMVGVTQGVLYSVLKYVVGKKESLLAVLTPILMLSIVTICASYLAIYIKIKCQQSIQQKHQQEHYDPHQQQRHHHQAAALKRASQRERELAFTLFIVTVSSLISWLPYALMQLFFTTVRIPVDVIYGVTLLQCTNSLVNPVIYVFRMQEFRRALIHFVCRCYYPHVSPMDQNKTIELTIPATDGGEIRGSATNSNIDTMTENQK